MEGYNNFKIKKEENDDGETFVRKLTDLIIHAAGNKNSIIEILKSNIYTESAFLDEYVDLLTKASDKKQIASLIGDIGNMVNKERNIFFSYDDIGPHERDNPIWKKHQDSWLEMLNELREKNNLPKISLNEMGDKLSKDQ